MKIVLQNLTKKVLGGCSKDSQISTVTGRQKAQVKNTCFFGVFAICC